MWDDGPGVPSERKPLSSEREEMADWPDMMVRPRRSFFAGLQSGPLGAILAISLGANVAFLVVLVIVLSLARAGYFSPHVVSTPSVPPGASATNTTSGATPSPTPSQGWLQVAPASIQLGCDGGQQRQYAVLMNTGSEDVQWQAVFSIPADEAGVDISPHDGDLQPGTSISLRIQSNGNASGQQGTIRFDTDTNAGPSPTLSFTTANCQ